MKSPIQKKITTLTLFLSLFFFSSAKAAVIAKVGNTIITKNEIEERYKFIILTSNIKIKSNDEKNILLNRIIDKMIDEEIIRQEAQNLGISIEASEITNAINQTLAQNNQSIPGLKGFFSANGISFNAYEKQVTTDLLWTKIITQHLKTKVSVNDSEVREVLEQNNIEAKTTKFHLAEIFIPKSSKNSKEIAEKLAQELKKGADFNKIVQQFSSNVTAQTNGDLGWVDEKSLNKDVFEKISKLEKGQNSAAIMSADGYRIFKVLDKKTTNEINQNDLQTARNIIFIKKLQVVAKSYLMELRRKYFIENSYY